VSEKTHNTLMSQTKYKIISIIIVWQYISSKLCMGDPSMIARAYYCVSFIVINLPSCMNWQKKLGWDTADR